VYVIDILENPTIFWLSSISPLSFNQNNSV
jgi:hypothetical protein